MTYTYADKSTDFSQNSNYDLLGCFELELERECGKSSFDKNIGRYKEFVPDFDSLCSVAHAIVWAILLRREPRMKNTL